MTRIRAEPTEPMLEGVRRAISIIAQDKWAAHKVIFKSRHTSEEASFHRELVDEFWSDEPYSQVLAFRGGAKSTYLEEDVTLAAVLQRFRNILIIGASETRAAERLASISYELDNNEMIAELFGRMRGGAWTQTKLVTPFGCIQAMGRDQDIRGIKHLEWRPDLVVVDDFEDKDNVQSPSGRTKTLRWFLAELLPACAPYRKVRVRATPMDAESVPMQLKNVAKWPTRTFPIEIVNDKGQRQATWPALFDLDWIDREKRNYRLLGQLDIWDREYMCEAVSESSRVFTEDTIRVRPIVRTYEAVYAMFDPARTLGERSATTGYAAWSWVRNRLIVWDSDARQWRPDEIIAKIFAVDDEFAPIWIGVEEDGLNEWLMQPIRQEQLRRGRTIPVRPVRAPRGKFDFIRGLQPFFAAGEVEFAGEQTEMRAQLLSFPRGNIDAPNALAYALSMRPGTLVYDGFTGDHAVERLEIDRRQTCWLAFNATRVLTTAVLLQYAYGRLRIFADFAYEGDPAETAPMIVRDASMLARMQPVAVCGLQHFDQWQNVGLAQALKAIPVQVDGGSAVESGREALRAEFARLTRGEPAVQIARVARHTLNALAGGYCRGITRQGVLMNEAEPGLYRVLMEGLEACLGVTLGMSDGDNEANWSYTQTGQRYRRYTTGYDRRA